MLSWVWGEQTITSPPLNAWSIRYMTSDAARFELFHLSISLALVNDDIMAITFHPICSFVENTLNIQKWFASGIEWELNEHGFSFWIKFHFDIFWGALSYKCQDDETPVLILKALLQEWRTTWKFFIIHAPLRRSKHVWQNNMFWRISVTSFGYHWISL